MLRMYVSVCGVLMSIFACIACGAFPIVLFWNYEGWKKVWLLLESTTSLSSTSEFTWKQGVIELRNFDDQFSSLPWFNPSWAISGCK